MIPLKQNAVAEILGDMPDWDKIPFGMYDYWHPHHPINGPNEDPASGTLPPE